MGYLTIRGHTIRADGDTYELPCVTGEGTALVRGTMLVDVGATGATLARTGEPLVARGTEQLTGWGNLDGEATDYGTSSYSILIPNGIIERLHTHSRA